MDIVLHLGAHRCGTTTLQHFLLRNRLALRGAGMEIWTPDRIRSGLFGGLMHPPEEVTAQTNLRAQRSQGIIAIETARLRRDGFSTLLVSEENMIGGIRGNLGQGQIYPRLRDRLARLRPAFPAPVRRIGLAVRSYDTCWASALAYGIGQGMRLPSVAELDRLVTQPRRWRDVIADVAAVFCEAEIVVWPFERLAGQPEAQLDLLTGGLRPALPLSGMRDWVNASPRRDKLRRLLHLRGDDDGARRIAPGDDRLMPFDPAQQGALRAQYHADIAWLRAGADGLARFYDGVDDRPYDRTDDRTDPSTADADKGQTTRRTTRQIDRDDVIGAGVDWARLPPDGGQSLGRQDIMV